MVALLLMPRGASLAFTTLGDPAAIPDVRSHLEAAPRWPSPDGRTVVLQVASMPGFGAALGATQEEIDAANQVVADAFAAWSSPALRFEVLLEDPGVTGQASPEPLTGFDIDVFAVPGTHPVFAGTAFFGFASVATAPAGSRLLTNGQDLAGDIIEGADVYLNIDAILPFKTGVVAIDAQALKRLLMHEVGHALGLGHPNDNNPFGAAANLDSDQDPQTPVPVDPLDPFAGLAVSPFPDNEAVMSNRPCGEPPVLPCLALLHDLRADDLSGRDVLYPALPAVPLAGRKLLIRNAVPDDPAKNRVVLVARDPAVSIPAPGSPDDPRIAGATLEVVGESSFSAVLPASGWTLLGKESAPKGYRYLDRGLALGPCKAVVVKAGVLVRAVCRGGGARAVDYDLVAGRAESQVDAELTLGAGFGHCARFGGTVVRDGSDGKAFVAKAAPPPSSCP